MRPTRAPHGFRDSAVRIAPAITDRATLPVHKVTTCRTTSQPRQAPSVRRRSRRRGRPTARAHAPVRGDVRNAPRHRAGGRPKPGAVAAPGGGDRCERPPPVVVAALAGDEALAHHPVHEAGETAPAEHDPVGEVLHAEPAAVRLDQLHEHVVHRGARASTACSSSAASSRLTSACARTKRCHASRCSTSTPRCLHPTTLRIGGPLRRTWPVSCSRNDTGCGARRSLHAVQPTARPRTAQRRRVYLAETPLPVSPLPGLDTSANFGASVVGTLWWWERFPDRPVTALPRMRPGNGPRQAFYGRRVGRASRCRAGTARRASCCTSSCTGRSGSTRASLTTVGPSRASCSTRPWSSAAPTRPPTLRASYRAHQVHVGRPPRRGPDGHLRYGWDERLRLRHGALGSRSRAAPTGNRSRSWPASTASPAVGRSCG